VILLKKMVVMMMIDLVGVGECKEKCWVLQCGKGKAKMFSVREIIFSVLSFRHQMTCPNIYNVPTQ